MRCGWCSAHTATPRLKERLSIFSFPGHSGMPISGRVSNREEGLSNRRGEPGVCGEEILEPVLKLAGGLFSGNSPDGEARRGASARAPAYPPWVCDRGATKPSGLLPENPPGGRSYVRGRRWLAPYNPLRGCSVPVRKHLAAFAPAK